MNGTLTPAQHATAEASMRDLYLGRLELATTLRDAFACARQARAHGANADETLTRLEAWAAERGLA